MPSLTDFQKPLPPVQAVRGPSGLAPAFDFQPFADRVWMISWAKRPTPRP